MPQNLFPTMENFGWKEFGLKHLDGKLGQEIFNEKHGWNILDEKTWMNNFPHGVMYIGHMQRSQALIVDNWNKLTCKYWLNFKNWCELDTWQKCIGPFANGY